MVSQVGGSGNDTLYGGSGDDTLDGGAGNDSLYGRAGDNSLSGGEGDDYLHTYTYSGENTLSGGTGNDSLYGGIGNDSLIGGEGSDSLAGYEGNDTLDGGLGDDDLYGGAGDNSLSGGEGDDYLHTYTHSGENTLSGGTGNDSLHGGIGNDSLTGGEGKDYLEGYEGNDSLTGGAGDDDLRGYQGDDSLVGGSGNDTLNGGAGDDTYYINDLNDYIYDIAGDDKAVVSISFAKIPSYIEDVEYINSAQALPYWISALLLDESNGNYYTNLISSDKTFFYVFPDTIPEYDDDADHAIGYTALSSIQQENAVKVLTHLEGIIDVNIEETDDASQYNTISIALNNQENSGGYARNPGTNFVASDIWLNNKSYNSTLAEGTFGSSTIVHELGHALGLKHPFSDPTPSGSVATAPYLEGDEDHGQYSMMSYTRTSAEYKHTYSPLDIAALQYLYGTSKTARTENDTYVVNSNDTNIIWDGNGTDTIDASTINQGATIYLSPGYHGFVGPTKDEYITAAGQITVNFGTVIENLNGSNFADKLYGNTAANNIIGNSGNDTIEGSVGDDTIDGSTGTDTVSFSGLISEYSAVESGYSIIVTDTNTSRDGIDTLTSIEAFDFAGTSAVLSDLLNPTDVDNGVYRFFNLATGTHFYSASPVERNHVINNHDSYNYEGASFKSAEAANSDTAGVHRFFNTQSGTHFFTQSELEKENVIATLPHYTYENIEYQAYTSQVDDSIALYRFFNTLIGSHFFTPSEAERDSVIENLPVYNYEGIAYYVDAIV